MRKKNEQTETSDSLPVLPALDLVVDAARFPVEERPVSRRLVTISLIALLLGIAAAFIAQLLIGLIALITNLAFYGQISLTYHSPARERPS